MNSLILLLALSGQCEGLASIIMEKRQSDVPFRLMLKAINFDAYGSSPEQKRLARKLALKAYRIPLGDKESIETYSTSACGGLS